MNLITEWSDLTNNHMSLIKNLIGEFNTLSREYELSKSMKFDIGFNIFKISSDFYYRENFQSDIICALLNPNESHNEKNKYLHLFIDMLNQSNNNVFINKSDFENSNVEREINRIDILITDSLSKKAIIIENKINNANDTYRQLPKYVEIIRPQYEIQAIVYITLNSNKMPNTIDWTDEEKKYINNLLKIIPSYEPNNNLNLYNNWIVPSIIASINIDSLFILKQYGNLIKYLNTNTMDIVTIEKFYAAILESDKLQTAKSIRNMLSDLPEYLAIRLENKYKKNCYPFKSVWRHKLIDTVFEGCEFGNLYLKLDIWCNEDGYKVYFWNPRDANFDILAEFSSFEPINIFQYSNGQKNNIYTHFGINSENELIIFIDKLILELTKRKETYIV
jgi:hypothetical protein